MNQCEETEEGVHPSETPLCGQHDNQTKAQRRRDFRDYPSSDSKKKVATADRYSVLSSDSCRKKQKMNPPTTQELGVGSSAGMETMSTHLSMAAPQVVCRPVWLGSPRSKPMVHIEVPFRAAASLPQLGSGGSPSSYSEKDITRRDDDSVLSPASRISLGSPASSVSSYVSNQSKRSIHRDIDFKKKLGSGGSPSLYSEKDITRNDDDSVLSPASRISLGSPTSSGYRRVSNQSKSRLYSSGSLFSHPLKKVAAADRYSVLSSDSGLGSGVSSSSYSEKDVATSDYDSDQSSCSRISLGSRASSVSSCVSNQSKRSTDRDINFKKKKKQNMSPPTTQELGVGSSAWMETMSTHPPMAVPTSLPTTMWRPDASTSPLPATREEAIRKQKTEMLRGNQDLLGTYMNTPTLLVSTPSTSVSLPPWLDSSDYLLLHLLMDIATADDDSVLSSDSGEEEKDELLHHPGACCWK